MDLLTFKSKHKTLPLWLGSLVWIHNLQKLIDNIMKETEKCEKSCSLFSCVFPMFLNVGQNQTDITKH